MQPETLSDIVHLKNVVIGGEAKNNIKTIHTPVIKIETLHSCYSHAVLDCAFPAFWVIDDLKKQYNQFSDFIVLISNKLIFQYPHSLNFIDDNKKKYKGSYYDLSKILTSENILFEHLIEEPILIKDLFVYPEQDFYQRSPWNCNKHYPGRHVDTIRFSDEVIYSKLNLFRNRVLEYSNVKINYFDKSKLIIIDRKYNRKFEKETLDNLTYLSRLETSWTFNGVFYTEDLDFKEQVSLFASNNIFILRHGSSFTNLLWCPPESKIFEIEGGPEGVGNAEPVLDRIAKLTNSKRYYLKYSFDAKKDIFSKL